LASTNGSGTKQTLILAVTVGESDDEKENDDDSVLEREVLALYKAAAVEKKDAPEFDQLYDLQVVSAADASKVGHHQCLVCVYLRMPCEQEERSSMYMFLLGLCDIAFHRLWSVMLFCFLFLCLLLTLLSSCLLSEHQVLSMASAAATQASKGLSSSSPLLSAALSNALTKLRESGVASVGLDPPHIANAFMTVGNVYAKQTKSARAKIASWRSRVSRGLWVDGFGRDATNLRQRILSTFDSETLAAAGLPLVASYRLEMRKQLQELLDNAVIDMFN
jgi:hypothetical protein